MLKNALLVISVAFVLVRPALAQDKEQDRVENAGKVMQEILNIPDGIPKSVLDWHWKQLRSRGYDVSRRRYVSRSLERSNDDGTRGR
jgi:hypothetical protein